MLQWVTIYAYPLIFTEKHAYSITIPILQYSLATFLNMARQSEPKYTTKYQMSELHNDSIITSEPQPNVTWQLIPTLTMLQDMQTV